ncbi:MAG: hypothetical protein ACPHRO_00495 [Nannocystaceae bacterium]
MLAALGGIAWWGSTGCEGRRPATRELGARGDQTPLEGAAVPPRLTRPGVRTPNADPNGADNQPDWDAKAAQLRARIGPTLRVIEDADPREMCARLLTEAGTFYGSLAGDDTSPSSASGHLSQTAARDIEGCVAELSPRAIACVSASLSERSAEFPWLVDQCARAFPKAPNSSAPADSRE